jgi:hypothetical protein
VLKTKVGPVLNVTVGFVSSGGRWISDPFGLQQYLLCNSCFEFRSKHE